jgi:hypothetical protein
MVAQSVTAQRSDPNPFETVVRLAHALAVATAAMLLLLGLWLLTRRINGQLQHPLGVLPLAVVATTLVALVALVRIAWGPASTFHAKSRRSLLVWAMPTLAILMFAWALSISGTGPGKLAMFWSVLIGAEGAWWWVAFRQIRRRTADRSPGDEQASIVSDRAPLDPPAEQADEDEEAIPPDVYQQLTRRLAAQEQDTVSGLLRAKLEPQERSASLHVAFCPPMLRLPDVTVVQLSGPRARIKPGEVQPFGVRFDLRLAGLSETVEDVLIHFEARCGKPPIAGVGGIPDE